MKKNHIETLNSIIKRALRGAACGYAAESTRHHLGAGRNRRCRADGQSIRRSCRPHLHRNCGPGAERRHPENRKRWSRWQYACVYGSCAWANAWGRAQISRLKRDKLDQIIFLKHWTDFRMRQRTVSARGRVLKFILQSLQFRVPLK